MPARVLVLGRPRDPHVVAVRRELRRRGHSGSVLDPRRFPGDGALTLAISSKDPLRAGLAPHALEDVDVGWVAAPPSVRTPAGVAPAARRFARAAAQQGLESLLRATAFPWVNDPDAALRADDKVLQLATARKAGLLVPDTLYTTDPAAVRAFAARHGRVVAKSHSGSRGLPEDQRILTKVVGPGDLARAGEVRHAPVCFQEYVPKASELRVTVVGSRVHAVRIHSQEQARTRDDWRRYGPALRYSVAQLSAGVRRRCIAVARQLGLDYGGIDLVQRPDGKHVFLEINTLPAWLWLEDATEEPITASLVDHLERAARKGKKEGKGG